MNPALKKKLFKWYRRKRNTLLWILSLILTVILIIQNYNLTNENKITQNQNNEIRRENEEIKHEFSKLDAYRNKGLYEAGKLRETAYFDVKTRYERVLKLPQCKLPNDLAVLPEYPIFESLESALMKGAN